MYRKKGNRKRCETDIRLEPVLKIPRGTNCVTHLRPLTPMVRSNLLPLDDRERFVVLTNENHKEVKLLLDRMKRKRGKKATIGRERGHEKESI